MIPRDELLLELKAIHQNFLDRMHGVPMTKLRTLITRIEDEPELLELIYEGGAEVFDVRGETAYADAGTIRIRGKGLKEGQLLEVQVFLAPASPS